MEIKNGNHKESPQAPGKRNNKINGGVHSRIGKKFCAEVEKIKDARLRNGRSKERVSTEKITNLITRHNSWKNILSHIVDASQEEVNQYGI